MEPDHPRSTVFPSIHRMRLQKKKPFSVLGQGTSDDIFKTLCCLTREGDAGDAGRGCAFALLALMLWRLTFLKSLMSL